MQEPELLKSACHEIGEKERGHLRNGSVNYRGKNGSVHLHGEVNNNCLKKAALVDISVLKSWLGWFV